MSTVIKLGTDHFVVPALLFTEMQRIYVLWNEGLLVERDPAAPPPSEPPPVGAREDIPPAPFEDAPDESVPPAAPRHLNSYRPPTEADYAAMGAEPPAGGPPPSADEKD